MQFIIGGVVVKKMGRIVGTVSEQEFFDQL